MELCMKFILKKQLLFMFLGTFIALLPSLSYCASATTTTASSDDSFEQLSDDIIVTPQYRVMQLLHTLAALNDALATAQFEPNELFQVQEKVEREKKNIAHELNTLRNQISLPLIALNFLGFWFLREANKNHDPYYITLTYQIITELFNFAKTNHIAEHRIAANAVALTLYYVAPESTITDRELALTRAINAIWQCKLPKAKAKCIAAIKHFHGRRDSVEQHPERQAFNQRIYDLCIAHENEPKDHVNKALANAISYFKNQRIKTDEYRSFEQGIVQTFNANPCLLQRAPHLLSALRNHAIDSNPDLVKYLSKVVKTNKP